MLITFIVCLVYVLIYEACEDAKAKEYMAKSEAFRKSLEAQRKDFYDNV